MTPVATTECHAAWSDAADSDRALLGTATTDARRRQLLAGFREDDGVAVLAEPPADGF